MRYGFAVSEIKGLAARRVKFVSLTASSIRTPRPDVGASPVFAAAHATVSSTLLRNVFMSEVVRIFFDPTAVLTPARVSAPAPLVPSIASVRSVAPDVTMPSHSSLNALSRCLSSKTLKLLSMNVGVIASGNTEPTAPPTVVARA